MAGSYSHILTARQRQILELKASGLKNVEIARRLGISDGSINDILRRAQARLARLCEVCGEDPAGDSGLCGFCREQSERGMA
jgi:DNA-directed RNA polymerase specialized sigma24 family protein